MKIILILLTCSLFIYAKDGFASKQAFENLQEASDTTDGKTLFTKGLNHEVNNEMKEALNCYARAADEFKYLPAMTCLGYFYINDDEGYPADPIKGIEYWIKAAENGCTEAQNNLGFAYLNGLFGCPSNLAKAKEYIASAAAGGDKRAQHQMGMFCIEEGNKTKAFEWFTQSADFHNSQRSLGQMYKEGWEGQAPDQHQAFEWFLKASLQKPKQHSLCLNDFIKISPPAVEYTVKYKISPESFKKINEVRRIKMKSLHSSKQEGDDTLNAFFCLDSVLCHSLNEPGFLITNVKQTDQFPEQSNSTIVSYKKYPINNTDYVCLGIENIKNADIFVPLLSKMQEFEKHFPSVKNLQNVSAEEKEWIIQAVKEVSTEFLTTISSQVDSRSLRLVSWLEQEMTASSEDDSHQDSESDHPDE
jgi:tetratricopeptide (TPR) repeat protein